MKKYVAYYRTSTNRQNLGIDAQKTMVQKYLDSVGGILIDEVEEKESGKNDNREGLERAISICEKNEGILIIAKLDRLSRSVSFLFQLRDRVAKHNVEIKALDLPSFNTMTLGIWATMAQAEREAIASRTKLALAELKKLGVILGKPENFTHEHRIKGAEAMKQKAMNNKINIQTTALIVQYREKGLSYEKIVDLLTKNNFRTVTGKIYTSMAVMRLYKRHINNQSIKDVA
ncbi:recombinase family protein [Fluviicola sp. SGL-29]|nr:recombinase family protein [Fluviicola sp. SGL-29]